MTLLGCVLATVLAAGPAAGDSVSAAVTAGDLAKAKELFTEGQKLYKAGSYAEAIAKFEQAYAMRPHPAISYNIGKSYEQLGESGKAMRAFRDYLRLQPEAKDKEQVLDGIANLERRLREKGVQQMMVFADPPAARVEIDGKDLGVQPASAELTSGVHKIAVRASGYDSVERTFIMSISRAAEMTINLAPVSTPTIPVAGVAKAPPSDAPQSERGATLLPSASNAAANVEPAATTSATSSQPAAKRARVFTWVAAGLAVGAAGAGVGMGVMANTASANLRAQVHSQSEAQGYYNQASTFSTGANIAYGVAAGLAITAVVLFFVEK